MTLQAVLLLCLYVWGVSAKVDHAELRGEHSKQEDIDNGECIPMHCVMGAPPTDCKRLCNLRNYETICQPPGDFCLCQHMVNGKMKLVSPDEVVDQPPDSSEVNHRPSEKSRVVKKPQVASTVTDKIQHPMNVEEHIQASEAVDQPQEKSESDSDDGVVSFQIFAIFVPIKRFLFDDFSMDAQNAMPEPTKDTLTAGYETVNVHEGRLFWDFRYILTGLLLLMIGLVVYELVMCAVQVYGSKRCLSVSCEVPEIKVKPNFIEKEKILNL